MVSSEHNTDIQKLHTQVTEEYAKKKKGSSKNANVAIAALVNYFYLLDCVDHVLEVWNMFYFYEVLKSYLRGEALIMYSGSSRPR